MRIKKRLGDLIIPKKEELEKLSAGKNNIDLLAVVKRIEQTSSDNIEETNSAIEKAKEGFASFVSASKDEKVGNSLPLIPLLVSIFTFTKYGDTLERKEAKEKYDEIIKNTNTAYEKSSGELTDLLGSSLEKMDTALYSEFEAIYKDYTAAYSDFLASNYTLQKYKQSSAFDVKQTIPNSYFDNMRIKDTSSASIPVAKMQKTVEKTISSCWEYHETVFASTKKDFLLETEKCKVFYLERLVELQDTVREKLTTAKHIEQEITVLENRIECLDELQKEINK